MIVPISNQGGGNVTSNTSNVPHQSGSMLHPARRGDRVISSPAMYRKKNGVLTLNMREKTMVWTSHEDSNNLVISLDKVIETKKETKESNQTELLYLKVSGMERGVIFAFSGDRRIEQRDRFFDYISRRDDEYEKLFKSLSSNEKKKILQVMIDSHLLFLFEELVINSKIISKEEFFIFLRKRYNAKISFLNSPQCVQLARSEEIRFFSNPFRNLFSNLTKKKLLLAYDALNYLFESEVKSRKSEVNFWREFLNHQRKNNTEIVGGFKPIYFTHEDEVVIKSEKEKVKGGGNITGGNIPTSGSQVNHTSTATSSASTMSSFTSKIQKYSKKWENVELHKNYIHKHFGSCLNVQEYDYKDKEIKKISAAMSEEEEFNKKEMSNFIESINNYSCRKLENVNYISTNNFYKRSILLVTGGNVYNNVIQVNGHTVPHQKYSIEKNYNGNGVHSNNLNSTNLSNKKLNATQRFAEMNMEFSMNKNKPKTRKDSVDTFKKINELVNQNTLANFKLPIPEKDRHTLETLKGILHLLLDLGYIYQNVRKSTFSEEAKKIKRMTIKNLSQSIEDKLAKIEREESLNPIIKPNLDIFKAAIEKLK